MSSSSGVLFINPNVRSPSSTRLPLSLLSLGAVLEGRRPWRIVDGNVEADPVRVALTALKEQPHALVAVTVMTGPQVEAAIEISAAIRAAFPSLPIVWGGYFPTLYPDAAINAPYVDYLVRGQGEETLFDLLEHLPDAGPPSRLDSAGDPAAVQDIPGLTWKRAGEPVHNRNRPVAPPGAFPLLPYERVDVRGYLRPSFLGARTAVYQSALGCRYRCEFCGVVSMWNGKTVLEAPERMLRSLSMLRDRWGADCVMFYDHNFFDREETSIPMLEALATLKMPYWCFARTDTLARFSTSTWEKVRKSGLRMAFMGAEAATDDILNQMKKGSRVEHTLEAAGRCREYGVTPEFSFILGGPEDPEDQIDRTFAFIRRVKGVHPDAEIILYYYSPTPQRDRKAMRGDAADANAHLPVLRAYGPSGPSLPTTPEEWTDPRWVTWVCHEDAPWLTPRIRQRVKDFARVLACRFPTAQDYRKSPLSKAVLRNLARVRYATRYYDHSWELALAQRLIRLRNPRTQSL
jgi:anaerobic magnesium-protoporphyrin IX monomethyl ester cyclase